MNGIKAIICDDEDALRMHLRKKLSSLWRELVICGEAGDGVTALNLVEKNRPDIAFLDIKMPGLSGIEVAKKVAGKCLVVFITAYDRYAVEAFENEAIDYLIKPVTDKRLEKTVHRLQKKMATFSKTPMEMAGIFEKVALALGKDSKHLQWVKVKHGESIRLIAVNEIYYFKAEDKYTRVRTKEGEFLIRKTIKELTDELDPNQFWNIHRATIVNVQSIARASRSLSGRYELRLKDLPEMLTVSRAYAHLFRQM